MTIVREFTAMGTHVELLLDDSSGADAPLAFAAAEAEFERLEAMLSRFRPHSQLSELNRTGALTADLDLLRVTELALDARDRTDGRFDPTVHDALVAAGYDRTFADVVPDGGGSRAGAPCAGRVIVDPASGLIELEPGVHLDLGGIAKGYAVDAACALLAVSGRCLVNAGGDIATRGAWTVGVETPDATISLELESGALATSGRDRRRWRRNGEERHHLIDPTTGVPAASDLLRVTVFAETAVDAEVLATALFLDGAEAAADEADRLGTPCVLVTESGRTLLAGGLA